MKDYYREGLELLAEGIGAQILDSPFLFNPLSSFSTIELEEQLEKNLREISQKPITILYFQVVSYSGRVEESLLMELFSEKCSKIELLREGTDQIMKFHNFIKDICLNN